MDYVSLFCTVAKVKKKQYHTLRTVVCQINGFYLLNASSNQIFIIVSRYFLTHLFPQHNWISFFSHNEYDAIPLQKCINHSC